MDSFQGCDFMECALEKYMQEPLKRPFKKPDNTENVWKEYNEVSFGKFVKNHYKEPFLSVVKRSLKRKIKEEVIYGRKKAAGSMHKKGYLLWL